jgi:vancomycin aglycone glucosyltransferase
VADLRIGAAHNGSNPTSETLSDALGTVLTPEVGARAAELSCAAVAAKLLIDLVMLR